MMLKREQFFQKGHAIAVYIFPDQRDCEHHTHEFWEVQIITKGKATHRLDGNAKEVQKGDVFVIPEGAGHAYSNTKDLGVINLLYIPEELEYKPDSLNELPGYHVLFNIEPQSMSKKRESVHLRLEPNQLMWLENFVGKMQRETEKKTLGLRAFLMASFFEFQVEISKISSKTASTLSHEHEVGTLVSFFVTHYNENITLDDCSKLTHMSRSSLNRFFNEYYNMSPLSYLMNVRLAQAESLLFSSDLSITNIAFDCGFRDSNYFSKLFKKMNGLSPHQYRKRHLTNSTFLNVPEVSLSVQKQFGRKNVQHPRLLVLPVD